MGELAVRRNRGFAIARRQEAGKAEKPSGIARGQGPARTAGLAVSESLRQMLSKTGQAEGQVREGRRTLRMGEAVLAEVQDRLGRAAELAGEAAGDGAPDRGALQAELERLGKEIGRMLAAADGNGTRLFLDGGMDGDAEIAELLAAVMEELPAEQDGAQALPDWLTQAITQDAFTPEQLLAALGAGKAAGGAELLAAVANSRLEGGSAAGYLAALYLGAVIAGGGESSSPETALEGLRQLLEKVAEGVPPDEAVEQLTNGAFTSLSDFQSQFTGGTAPGLQDFLVELLLSGGSDPILAAPPLLTLLMGAGEMDLMMGLLDALGGGGAALEAAAVDGTDRAAPETEGSPAGPSAATVQLGGAQVSGKDLSGVSFDEAAGRLEVSGTADVAIQGNGQEVREVVLTGSGTVAIQNLKAAALIVESAAVRVFSVGGNTLDTVQLRPGASLTFEGSGFLKIGGFQADGSNALRLTGGAVAVGREREEEDNALGTLALPVLLEGPASLAARAASVSGPGGKTLDAFDVIWKTLLPDWSAMTAIEVDGKRARMVLDPSNPVRLWLDKGDPSNGYPAHTVAFHGRDKAGRPRLRYAYLRWNQREEAFEETAMYPNPFTVTGGEAGRDWIYEEEDHTLHILTAQVAAISGGSGLDANREPFSGRIALADGIGAVELALEGVVCLPSSGRAFSLGRGNDVALLLRSGTDSRFESGEGCAGISLGDGTTLRIDRAEPLGGGKPAGTLAATGGAGGAGIGRDSGGSRDQTCHILILGGVITATGNGGGAGIGGALDTPVGNIGIRGGRITAEAGCHAAAIGAGVRGACGEIRITGTARIEKAQGGDPGADIGACLFGSCGKVEISGAADIGSAGLRTKSGVSLRKGEDAVTLPQFRLSAGTLRLDRLSVATREAAQAAKSVIDADRRWVAQIQDAYSALYTRLEQGSGGLHSVRQYIDAAAELVRDETSAGALLEDMRQSIPQAIRTHSGRGTGEVRLLLE